MLRSPASRLRFKDYTRQRKDERKQGVQRDRHGKKIERQRSFVELLSRFWWMVGVHQRVVLGSLVLLSLSVMVGLLPLYSPKIVVDYVLGDEPVPAWLTTVTQGATTGRAILVWLVCAALLLTGLSVLLGLWGRWEATKISKRLQVEARRDVFDHASRLPLHRIYELKSGGVSSLLRDDAGTVGELIFNMIYNPWRAIIQLAGSLLVLAYVDWKLLAMGLLILPLSWFTHKAWISNIRPIWRDIRTTRREIDGTSTETFGGMRIVRAFNRVRAESTAFMKRNDFHVRQELLSWWWGRGVDTAWALIIPTASAALLLYGSLRIIGDREAVAAGTMSSTDALTVGDLFVFLTYLTALLAPIAALAGSATGLQNGLAALDRVLDILKEPREFEDSVAHNSQSTPSAPRTLDRDTVLGRVTLDRVGFVYPRTTRSVLEDVSLEAPAGSTVALVGPSGSGKTTLCNLVARFYDPTAGRVLIDGIDLRDVDVDSYRGLLGVVEQDVFLFDGSVADNIAYGLRNAKRPQVEEAARLANAHGFIIDMPKGYDTLIGERGVKLSGGQRQRLAIARAILADPRILILDEATSNLDTESERLIQASLAKLMQGRTCFVIAHRLSTITHADQIVVLSGGRIIERGTHDDLMSQSGTYRGMIEMQVMGHAESHERSGVS